jgi:hypothetical protein
MDAAHLESVDRMHRG